MKHLVLLTDNYPNSNGEFFLDDEINIIASKFEKITILCSSPKHEKTRPTPLNVTIIDLPNLISVKRIYFIIQGLFFLPLWLELFRLKNRYRQPVGFMIFKIVMGDYVRSTHVIKTLKKENLINPKTNILYSYWHDYKALALARIRKKNGCRTIARCHRWDVYLYANTPAYLPFRKFIINELSLTCSISEDGIKYMNKTHNINSKNKILLSRLGKTNNRIPIKEKENKNTFLICSCSTLTKVKRVDLIIELIKILSKHIQIQWFHFGDGVLKDNLINLASKNLEKINFNFFGIKPNHEILDFYQNNYIDLFINLSSSEGIPVSIMEAQSAGIPVLATDVGGTSEIVNDENGFLIDKDFNMDFIAKRIVTYLKDNPTKISVKRESAYKNWNTLYNAKKNYLEFADLLIDKL